MRRRTGPFLSERGRLALASVLTVASALAFAVASENYSHAATKTRLADIQPAGTASQ